MHECQVITAAACVVGAPPPDAAFCPGAFPECDDIAFARAVCLLRQTWLYLIRRGHLRREHTGNNDVVEPIHALDDILKACTRHAHAALLSAKIVHRSLKGYSRNGITVNLRLMNLQARHGSKFVSAFRVVLGVDRSVAPGTPLFITYRIKAKRPDLSEAEPVLENPTILSKCSLA